LLPLPGFDFSKPQILVADDNQMYGKTIETACSKKGLACKIVNDTQVFPYSFLFSFLPLIDEILLKLLSLAGNQSCNHRRKASNDYH